MLTYARLARRARTPSWAVVSALALAVAACRPSVPPRPSGPGAATGPINRVDRLPDPLPAIAARVNGHVIPSVRVAGLARSREDRGSLDTGPNPAAMRESLQQLIVRELLFEEAVRRGLSPDALAIERAYDALRAGESEDARWLKRLSAEGLSKEELRQELRIQATVGALVQTLATRPPEQVSEEEARAYFASHPDLGLLPERAKLRQILVKSTPDANDADRAAAQKRAELLRDRLRAGEDFATLARHESDDGATRDVGGDLGVLGPGTLRGRIEELVRALQPGQTSEVLMTGDGFHIIKLEQRLPAEELPFEAVSRRVREVIVDREQRKAVGELVKQLESKAQIEVHL